MQEQHRGDFKCNRMPFVRHERICAADPAGISLGEFQVGIEVFCGLDRVQGRVSDSKDTRASEDLIVAIPTLGEKLQITG